MGKFTLQLQHHYSNTSSILWVLLLLEISILISRDGIFVNSFLRASSSRFTSTTTTTNKYQQTTNCHCSVLPPSLPSSSMVLFSLSRRSNDDDTTNTNTNTNTKKAYRLAQEILKGLPKHNQKQQQQQLPHHPKLLDLEQDLYDASTGLYSEGVWHNCLAGITRLQLVRHQNNQNQNNNDSEEEDPAGAIRIADALWHYSWDGTSFQRRAWSGNWDHAALLNTNNTLNTKYYQPHYYQESTEHRCIQHGMAVIFWTKLLVQQQQQQQQQDNNHNNHNKSNNNKLSRLRQQQSRILNQFVNEFFDPENQKWTTISNTQGSGTVHRPSASSAAVTRLEAEEEEEEQQPSYYYRAVDQAIAILACLEHLKLLNGKDSALGTPTTATLAADTNNSSRTHFDDDDDEKDRMVQLIQTTCEVLLRTTKQDTAENKEEDDGFAYSDIQHSKTYLGLDRNRNFWHEGWVMLALVSAKDYLQNEYFHDEDEDPVDADSLLDVLWEGLLDRYTTNNTTSTSSSSSSSHAIETTDDLAAPSPSVGSENNANNSNIWHWPISQKGTEQNVRYCGDNALAYAIRRTMRYSRRDSNNDNEEDDDDDDDDTVFWTFIETLRRSASATSSSDTNLVSVADAYPEIKLHPNTELMALLVWP